MTDVYCRISIYAFALCCLATNVLLAQDAPDDADAAIYELDEEDFAIDREGERCISTRNIRHTDILNERTILFRMRGGDYFVNYLRHDCPGLVREERFSYRTTGGRLCQVDLIRVIEQFGGFIQEGMSCGLGVFYPITGEEAEFLSLEPEERRGRPAIGVTNPNADQGEDEVEGSEEHTEEDAGQDPESNDPGE